MLAVDRVDALDLCRGDEEDAFADVEHVCKTQPTVIGYARLAMTDRAAVSGETYYAWRRENRQ